MSQESNKTFVARRNNVNTFGHGTRTMLFAHGFGCDQNMWRYLTPAFEKKYRIVLFDYVGGGKSDFTAYDAERYQTLGGYANDILEICDDLQLKDVTLVSHSVSGMIGLLAANTRPRQFSAHIMVSPSPCYINDGEYIGGFDRVDVEGLMDTMDQNYIGWANFLAPVIMKNADRPELAAELTESFCAGDPHIARRFAYATFFADNRPDLRHNTVPSLILQCTDDTIAPLAVGEYLERSLPNSTLKVLNATGHCPHLSHPKEVIEAMKAYLSNQI